MKTSVPPVLIAFSLACFALAPRAQAVVPPPDGGYPGFNTAEGQKALFSLTTGTGNVAVGWFSLFSDTTGSFNTATGAGTLLFNTGDQNTAFGAAALLSNATGIENTAVGATALSNNTTGRFNTASGVGALSANTAGDHNTATGSGALQDNTGGGNTATGSDALNSNTTGVNNTAIGANAIFVNTTGDSNTALGVAAGFNLTGSGNVCIGAAVIGLPGESDTTRIRNVYGSVASARAVYVNSDNKIGTLASSRRFKKEIKSMDKVSEAILALKPVTFRYKKEIERNSTIMFGLIAEEEEKADCNLVTRNDKGEAETVRYDAVNAMLLNEFLKARRQIDAQQKQIDALADGLQRVSAQLEASKPAPQVVNNP